MDVPKPHPPKPRVVIVEEKPQATPPITKPPFVRKPHLTDRPFRNLKTQLDSK